MKHNITKNQRIYREPTIFEKLRIDFESHKAIYGIYPQRIFIPEEALDEYMQRFPAFCNIFIKYKNVIDGKYPTFRGVELIPIKCKACEPKPNKFIAVSDIKNPKCSECGRSLLK